MSIPDLEGKTVEVPLEDLLAAYRGLSVLRTMCKRSNLKLGQDTAEDIMKRLTVSAPELIALTVLR